MHSDSKAASRRALIVIPGTVNYFYNLSGRRIAEALRALRFDVDVATLADCPEGEYDWCLLSNITEIVHSYGDEAGGLERIRAVVGRCGAVSSLSIDCVSTPWYRRIRDLSAQVGAGLILDLGLHDQGAALDPADRENYRFVLSGLTPSEMRRLEALGERPDDGRTIPWAFVGHATPHRAALVDHLIQTVDPGGFVYIPAAAPYTEKGSPHLNQEQFERVLGRTRYQIWCSHHSYFYMEPERFRSSLLTGGVPIKIVESRRDVPADVPLADLIMEPGDAGPQLTEGHFPLLRRRLWQEWGRFPTLGQEIARFLDEVGIETEGARFRAA